MKRLKLRQSSKDFQNEGRITVPLGVNILAIAAPLIIAKIPTIAISWIQVNVSNRLKKMGVAFDRNA